MAGGPKKTGGKRSRASRPKAEAPVVVRDEQGRVVAGSANLNPNGVNGNMKGYQPYGRRAMYWLDQLDVEGLRLLKKDKARWSKLGVYDAMIITNILDALNSLARGTERERLLSRIEGAPKQTLDVAQATVEVKHGKDNEAFRSILSRISGIRERLGIEPLPDEPEPT